MTIYVMCVDQETGKHLAFTPWKDGVVKAHSYTSTDEAIGRLVRENQLVFGPRVVDTDEEPKEPNNT